MIHGVINIYKEKGFTSHDVVAKMRGILHQKKIGHTGTLDPDAVGVLPVCLGAGTKLCDMLTDKDKVYRAVMLLGIETDTQDITGTVLNEKTVLVSEEAVRDTIAGFIGNYDQIPPMYSALKVNGKKLYELAREGKVIERKSRQVTIHDIQIEEISLPRVVMSVHCSKGTYIRTLCHDIGQQLGCGACMEALTRTRVGRFDMKDSITLGQLEELAKREETPEEGVKEILVPVQEMFLQYNKAVVRAEVERLLLNGNALEAEHFMDSEKLPKNMPVRVYDSQDHFCGIYEYSKQKKRFQPVKMFLECRNDVKG